MAQPGAELLQALLDAALARAEPGAGDAMSDLSGHPAAYGASPVATALPSSWEPRTGVVRAEPAAIFQKAWLLSSGQHFCRRNPIMKLVVARNFGRKLFSRRTKKPPCKSFVTNASSLTPAACGAAGVRPSVLPHLLSQEQQEGLELPRSGKVPFACKEQRTWGLGGN